MTKCTNQDRTIPAYFQVVFFAISLSLHAQPYDLIIKSGRVLDAKNQRNDILDVAITGNNIVLISTAIPAVEGKKVIDAQGLLVCPGLIDVHTHVFVGSKPGVFADGINSLSPDDFSFKSGVTTVVDAGTSGWRNFAQFKNQVIDKSRTRILAYLNIAGGGMQGDPMQQDIYDMDHQKTSKTILENTEILVGVKIGHYEGRSWTPFDLALQAATEAHVPLFVECHLPQYSLEEQLIKMRPGDMITHSYEKVSERMSVIDDHGQVRPFVIKARDRGVLFDVGHGGAGFWFSEAVPAVQQGLWPNSFGTDLHRFSMNAGMKDMLNVMSKFLNMGIPLVDVLERATWKPAQAIKRFDLGHLSPGSPADLCILRVREGNFGFVDAGGNRLDGHQKLEVEVTIKDGKVVWDLNGLSAIPLKK